MSVFRIIVIEDDAWFGEKIRYHLSLNPDYAVTKCSSVQEFLKYSGDRPDIITLDHSLPDGNGLDLLKKILNIYPGMPVIAISAQEDVTTAVDFLKLGASDYLTKDENTLDLLWNSILRIRENQSLKQEIADLREKLGTRYEFENIIKGTSPAIKKVFSLIEKASASNINVSVTGETGTGKELVAKAIHYNSDRRKKPFIALNMAAIPSELLESELFGHEKGAFTGAIARKTGKFEEANNGTIFLDEIGELTPALQSKLLRVLQEREFVRVGGHEVIKLNIRLVVATHQNLAELVRAGKFREDFYYRIAGMPICMPPLRERGNDILILAKYFLDNFLRGNKLARKILSQAAKDKLLRYTFPGNVRELRFVVELAAVMSDSTEITPDDMSFNNIYPDEILTLEEKTLKDYTINIISHFLKKYDNNVIRVADKLDIGKSTIYKMIQQNEILLN